MYILTDEQTKSLSRILAWWGDKLLKQGKVPEDDKRLQWMMSILSKKKYTDNAREFLNQMREMYLGKSKKGNTQHESKPLRSTVNVNGFPMV